MKSFSAGGYDVNITKYQDGKTAVTVDKNGEPWATLSVNIEVYEPEPGEFVLNHDCKDVGFLLTLTESGHLVNTGKRVQYGWCNQPVWRYVP